MRSKPPRSVEAERAKAETDSRWRLAGGVFGHGYTYTGHPVSCAGRARSTVAALRVSPWHGSCTEAARDLRAGTTAGAAWQKGLLVSRTSHVDAKRTRRVAQLAPQFQRRLSGLGEQLTSMERLLRQGQGPDLP